MAGQAGERRFSRHAHKYAFPLGVHSRIWPVHSGIWWSGRCSWEHSWELLYTGNHRVYTGIPRYTPCTAVHSATRLYTAIHGYTRLYTGNHRVYTVLHGEYSCTALHGEYRCGSCSTRLYSRVYSYTRLYTAIHGYTRLYSRIRLYTAVQRYSSINPLWELPSWVAPTAVYSGIP